jgi:hypothetical protein
VISSVLFAAAVLSYFPWLDATHNRQLAFVGHLRDLLHVNPGVWRLDFAAFVIYATALLLPLLVVLAHRRLLGAGSAAGALVTLAVVVWGTIHFHDWHRPQFSASFMHSTFPFLSNVVYNAGVGPMTLPDVAVDNYPCPHVSELFTRIIEGVLVAGAALWGLLVPAVARASGGPRLPREILGFAFASLVVSVTLPIQAFQLTIFDRYFVGPILALAIILPLLIERSGVQLTRARATAFVALLLPMGWLTVAGLHDYFRWNDARWSAGRALLDRGVSPLHIQGGYELNGWLNFDGRRVPLRSSDCIGACGCPGDWSTWHCTDESYRIAINPVRGFDIIDRVPVSRWLVPGSDILVLRRRAR